MKKTGILGGTFNPPHTAHLNMARAALTEAGLDEVIWIPNGDPPHKVPGISASDRLRMAELAVMGEPRMTVSDIEISRPGRSYMAETLEILSGREPDTKYYLICGEDMLSGLASWYRAARIFELADILAFQRKGGSERRSEIAGGESLEVKFEAEIGETVRFLERYGARIRVLETRLPDISSTALRKALAESGVKAGKLSALIPKAVLSYILEHGLYIESL